MSQLLCYLKEFVLPFNGFYISPTLSKMSLLIQTFISFIFIMLKR